LTRLRMSCIVEIFGAELVCRRRRWVGGVLLDIAGGYT
jgi:hypothetical protein